jgi:hypothetical protein
MGKKAVMVKCVNAHDRCFGGTSEPCPYCEPVEPPRHEDGKFAGSGKGTDND